MFLRALGGGCRVPIAAYTFCKDGTLLLEEAVLFAHELFDRLGWVSVCNFDFTRSKGFTHAIRCIEPFFWPKWQDLIPDDGCSHRLMAVV